MPPKARSIPPDRMLEDDAVFLLLQEDHQNPRQDHGHADPALHGEDLSHNQPLQEGGHRGDEAEDQQGYPASDLDIGAEETDISDKETDKAREGQKKNRTVGGDGGYPHALSQAQEELHKDGPQNQADDIDRQGSYPPSPRLEAQGGHGPSIWWSEGRQSLRCTMISSPRSGNPRESQGLMCRHFVTEVLQMGRRALELPPPGRYNAS